MSAEATGIKQRVAIAIFRQARVGKDDALFTLVKLRTMTLADDSASWATDQGHRDLRDGKFAGAV